MKFIKTYSNLYSCRLAFTLIELMIVVIILGVIAGFAIPSYTKAVERAYEKDARQNLILMGGMEETYLAKNGDYWPVGGGNIGIAGINPNLNLSIIENGVTYVCAESSGIPAQWYECMASRQGGTGWQLYISPTHQGVPCCDMNVVATCPTLPKCTFM